MDLLEQLREVGALKEGHFVLTSGRHSASYIEKFDLLRQPVATSTAVRAIVERFADEAIEVVVGPTTGGILLAFEIARQLGAAAAYAERSADGTPGREFRRGTVFGPRTRVLVVDDILTTGSSIRETLAALTAQGVNPVGIAVLVDRSGGKVKFGPPLRALAQLEIPTWEPDRCPLCAQGLAPTKPGSSIAVLPA